MFSISIRLHRMDYPTLFCNLLRNVLIFSNYLVLCIKLLTERLSHFTKLSKNLTSPCLLFASLFAFTSPSESDDHHPYWIDVYFVSSVPFLIRFIRVLMHSFLNLQLCNWHFHTSTITLFKLRLILSNSLLLFVFLQLLFFD